jgi:hypothetical protein
MRVSAWPCRSRFSRYRCAAHSCGRPTDAARGCAHGADRERQRRPEDLRPEVVPEVRVTRARGPVRVLRPPSTCGSDGTASWLCETARGCSGRNVQLHVALRAPSWLPYQLSSRADPERGPQRMSDNGTMRCAYNDTWLLKSQEKPVDYCHKNRKKREMNQSGNL